MTKWLRRAKTKREKPFMSSDGTSFESSGIIKVMGRGKRQYYINNDEFEENKDNKLTRVGIIT